MPRGRKASPEQIIAKLRQIEVQLAQGMSLALACKEGGLSEQSYYRWRREYGGLQLEQAKRLKELERENARLRRLVADLSLEKQVLKDVAAGNLVQPRAAPAGGSGHPRQVRPLGAPRLPPGQPAPGDPALRPHGPG
jgi:transposase-like protein